MNIFKKLGSAALKVADVGSKVNVPVLSEIDRIADTVKDVKVRSKSDREKLETVIHGLKELKTQMKPGTIEHKRLKVFMINGLAVLLIYAGLPPEVADEAALYVSGPAMAFILGDSYRGSK